MKNIKGICGALLLWVPLLAAAEPTRILHVMSYHSGWEWNQDQFGAFKAELRDLDVEYRVVELDGKRVSAQELEARADKAIQMIKEWKPDLVYANDDLAQEHVTSKFRGHKIPFVYSAVNKRPEDYGFDKAGNITGVLEEEHFLPTLSLLRSIKPGIKNSPLLPTAIQHGTASCPAFAKT